MSNQLDKVTNKFHSCTSRGFSTSKASLSVCWLNGSTAGFQLKRTTEAREVKLASCDDVWIAEQRSKDGPCGTGIALPPALGLHDPNKVWEQHGNTEVRAAPSPKPVCGYSTKVPWEGNHKRKHVNNSEEHKFFFSLPLLAVWHPSPPHCFPKGVAALSPETCPSIFLSRSSSLSLRCV